MLMEAPSTGLTVPTSFKIGDQSYNKETLIAQRDKDVKLVIRGVDDREGYKSAVTLRGQYRTLRTTLEKVRKEHFKPIQDYLKDYKAKTDELGSEAAMGEDYFDEMITAIDDEKERLKQEAIAAEQRRVQARVNDLTKLGAKFDGETYTIPYAEELFITASEIASQTSEQFGTFLIDVETAHNKEQERINNELLVQQQREEEQRQANLLIEQQAEQNKKDALALTEKRTKLRVKELMLMQFEETVMGDGDNLFEHEHSDRFFCLRDIQTLTDEDWEKSIEYHESKIMETRNVIAAKSMDEEIPATEPIADPQDNFVSTADVIAVVVSGGIVNNYSGVLAHAQQLSEENPSELVESDYSLNEFEKFIQQYFKGTEKVKQQFLLAIREYKELMDKM
jgi:hypothetical protein